MVDELTLTDLIESLLDWQENNHPGIFKYGQVDFRGAFARYFYFSAINQPSTILPLINASHGWELTCSEQELLNMYFELKALSNFKIKVIAFVKNSLSLAKILVIKLTGSFLNKKLNQKSRDKETIGFFALNNRFVFFYKEIVESLKAYKTVVFTPDIYTTRENILLIGAQPQKNALGEFNFHQFNISILNPMLFIYVNIITFYMKMIGSLNCSQTSVLVFAEGTSMEDEIASQAAKSLNIPTLRIQSGRGGVLHNGYINMSFNKMLCWGEGFVQHYKKASPAPEYVVTGSPVIAETQALSNSTGPKERNSITVFTQPINKYLTIDEYMLLFRVCENILKKSPTAHLVIRQHPLDKMDVYTRLFNSNPDRVILMPADSFSLAEVMCKSFCAIGFYSTTLTECVACNVIPIIIKLRNQHSVFPYPERHGAALVAENEAQVLNLLNELQNTPQNFNALRKNMRSFTDTYFGHELTTPILTIKDSILDSVAGK